MLISDISAATEKRNYFIASAILEAGENKHDEPRASGSGECDMPAKKRLHPAIRPHFRSRALDRSTTRLLFTDPSFALLPQF